MTAGLSVLFFVVAATAGAQEEFTNLEYFPQDISRPELMGAMRGFSLALGVRCTYCHEGEEGTPFAERDFASDARAPKRKAREMLLMVRDINQRYLALLPERREPPVAVNCATCHGGVPRPEAIGSIMERAVMEEGIEAAEARYRELREEFMGGAAYDFREQPLVDLGSRLVRAERSEDARRILLLNLEFNPESGQSMAGLGQIYDRAGEVEEALAWYKKSLEILPNPQVERRVRELGGGKDREALTSHSSYAPQSSAPVRRDTGERPAGVMGL